VPGSGLRNQPKDDPVVVSAPVVGSAMESTSIKYFPSFLKFD